jgi:hypothetical protein
MNGERLFLLNDTSFPQGFSQAEFEELLNDIRPELHRYVAR